MPGDEVGLGEDLAAGLVEVALEEEAAEEVLEEDTAAAEVIREDGNKEILWLQKRKLKKYLEKIW